MAIMAMFTFPTCGTLRCGIVSPPPHTCPRRIWTVKEILLLLHPREQEAGVVVANVRLSWVVLDASILDQIISQPGARLGSRWQEGDLALLKAEVGSNLFEDAKKVGPQFEGSGGPSKLNSFQISFEGSESSRDLHMGGQV